MATILRFDEPLRFEPFTYLGLDQYEVFIHEEGPSYNYFGFTRIPDELTAGKNLLAFTATENLVVGSEIAIEVLDAMGNLIPCRTADYIGDGLERIYSIEIDERVPQGDATITVMGVAKGRVQYDARKNLDRSESIPNKYYNTFNIRWQKRLQCNPKKRNSSDIIYFENPDIVVEEVFRPYHTLHYNNSLTSSYSTIAANTASTYTLCSTGSVGIQNTSASIKYAVQGNKYYIFAESNPDFGGFTDDMIGGTIFFPKPTNPFPSSNNSPYGPPIYNELEDGDGQGDLDTGSQEYSLQGAYNTFIIERLSPLQMRVNSPHTTFQGIGRQNQKEVLHQSFDLSEFRLDWAQSPVSWSNDLASGSNDFLTSYAKITFDKLTPLAGDVTRIKTYIRSDQSANEFQLQADTPVVSQEMLIQSESSVTRHSAGDFSKFGVSSSIDGTQGRLYWTSSAFGLQPNPDLTVFRAETDAILNPIVDSLQIGTIATATNLSSSTNHWLVDSTVPMLMQKDQYYQVEFKAYGVNAPGGELGAPKLGLYIDGEAMSDSQFDIGKLIGEISDIQNNQFIDEEDPLDQNKSKGVKFTFQADATGFGYLRFKVENGLWFIAEISVKPYDQYGYTPHHFECFIPTPKANVREMDALDFRFEFYNANHKKASYVSEIHNLQFENRFTLVATNTYIQSASIDNFFATTPIGDNDWAKQGHIAAQMVMEMPELTESIYHSGSVGIGNFAASTVDYPLHLKKESHEGNTTIKVESYSSSILHLAANNGSSYPNSRSAFILFDHANTLTSSIMGYTEVEDQDPGGVTMSGSTKGSFTIHERNGNVMSFGVGGTSRFHLVTGKSEGFRNAGSHGTFIGHQNPPPNSFAYELDVSGSIAVRSGTLFLPDLPTSAAPPVLIGLDSNNEAVKTNYSQILQTWNDDDWQVNTHYITQSRNTSTSTGKTVWIGDGNVITSVTPNSFMFQLSQSGDLPKIRMEGIPTSSTLTGLLGTLDSGDVYKTDGIGSFYLWKDLTTSITSSVDVFVSGSISASGDIVARSYIVESYTSSQLFSAGGTQFGDSHDDTHSFSGSITSSGEVSASGTGSFSHLAVPDMTDGVDNSVVIKDSDGVLRTDEIDPRVWGSTLTDLSNGANNRIVTATDANSLNGEMNFTFDGTNVQLAASGKHYFRNGNAWIHAPSQSLLEMSASEIVISSSKETYLYGPKVYIQGANTTETFLNVRGNITASGQISASGGGQHTLGGDLEVYGRIRSNGSLVDIGKGSITASADISASGLLYMSASENAAQTTYNVLVRDPATGLIYQTGSYGVGGSGGSSGVVKNLWHDGVHYWSASYDNQSVAQGKNIQIRVRGDISASGNLFIHSHSAFGRGAVTSSDHAIMVSGSISASGLIEAAQFNTPLGVNFTNDKHGASIFYSTKSTGHPPNSWDTDRVTIRVGTRQLFKLQNAINQGVGVGEVVVNADDQIVHLQHKANNDEYAFFSSGEGSGEIGMGMSASAGGTLARARLNIKQHDATNQPILVDSFQKPENDDNYFVWWDSETKLMYASNDFRDGPGTKNIIQFPAGLASDPQSPGFQIVSGSFAILLSGSVSSSTVKHYTSESFAMVIQPDPEEGGSGSSFMITGSGHSGIYFTSSGDQGRIGFGTTDPEEEIEFKADKIKFKQKTKDRGVEMNDEGNFESFAFETDGASTGSEIILKFARGTKASPIRLVEGDILGSIRWIQESGSLNKRSSGEMAAISAECIETTELGTVGSLNFNVASSLGSAASSNTMLKLDGPSAKATFGTTVQVSLAALSASGNISASGFTVAQDFATPGKIYLNSNVTGTGGDYIEYNNGGFFYKGRGDFHQDLEVGTSLLVNSHITASGNISSSGNIIGDRVYPNGFNDAFIGTFGGQIQSSTGFTGAHITSSGNISASGILYGEGLIISDDGHITDDFTVGGKLLIGGSVPPVVRSTLRVEGDIHATSHISGSNISASGDISARRFSGDGANLTNLPAQTANDFTNTLKDKLDAIEAGADNVDATNVKANLPSGVYSSSLQTFTNLTASGNISASSFIGQRINIALASANIATPTQNKYFYGGSNGLVSNTWTVQVSDPTAIPPQYINNLHIIPCGVKDVTLKSNQRCGHTQNPTIWIYTGSIDSDSNSNLSMGYAASQSLHGIADGETNGSGQHSYHINITGSKAFTPNPGHELIAVFMKNEGTGTQAWRFNYRLDGITTE